MSLSVVDSLLIGFYVLDFGVVHSYIGCEPPWYV